MRLFGRIFAIISIISFLTFLAVGFGAGVGQNHNVLEAVGGVSLTMSFLSAYIGSFALGITDGSLEEPSIHPI